MQPRCLVLVLALVAVPGALFAQSALPLLPQVRSAYQTRADAIAAGDIGNVFIGSASIAPNYGFPWMASLQIKGAAPQVAHFCGAVAVTPSWVLTAAHCVMAPQVSNKTGTAPVANFDVMNGSNLLFRGGKHYTVDRTVLHPDYRVTADKVPVNDLALIHITEAKALTPIPLLAAAKAIDVLKDGAQIRIFGWGTASFRPDGAISSNLLYAFVDVVGRAKCNSPDIYNGLVTDTMFCAGLGFADACQGDSGGPAIGYVNGEKYLVGVTSWGVGCANKKYPGVYVNVTKYADWIRQTAAN